MRRNPPFVIVVCNVEGIAAAPFASLLHVLSMANV
jgi:hypothetical protein